MKNLAFLLLAMTVAALTASAAEPWADAKLPTDKGLELWFDATKQAAGRAALKLPTLKHDAHLDVLLDGSGQQRDLAQRVADAQPRFRIAGANAFVRFDGKDDCCASVIA